MRKVKWTEAERFPYYDGTWAGPQAVLGNLLVPRSNDWDGFSAEAHEFVAEGDRVVSLGAYSGTFEKSGRSFFGRLPHVWTVRDDKLARFNTTPQGGRSDAELKITQSPPTAAD